MMLRIGKSEGELLNSSTVQRFNNTHGFSLVELMLTVVFVTLGSQMIQGGYLRSAEMFGRYIHTIQATVLAEEQIAAAREALICEKKDNESDSGVLARSGREYSWTREVGSADGPNLYSIRFSVSWVEGGKPFKLHREIYVYRPDPLHG
jgi:hypothetical protein